MSTVRLFVTSCCLTKTNSRKISCSDNLQLVPNGSAGIWCELFRIEVVTMANRITHILVSFQLSSRKIECDANFGFRRIEPSFWCISSGKLEGKQIVHHGHHGDGDENKRTKQLSNGRQLHRIITRPSGNIGTVSKVGSISRLPKQVTTSELRSIESRSQRRRVNSLTRSERNRKLRTAGTFVQIHVSTVHSGLHWCFVALSPILEPVVDLRHG